MSTATILQRAFEPLYPASLQVWETFVQAGDMVRTRKEEVLKAAHTREQYFYFMLRGSGGVLLWNRNNFICMDFCTENEILCDFMSFLQQTPSPIEVITFEESELLRISKAKYHALTQSGIGAEISRACSEALFMHKQQQQIDILTKTAKERYHDLQTRQAHLLQKIPQKYVASYLGITPQSLSRIRSELSEH
jgi:CRP-like cAMP-binding protein